MIQSIPFWAPRSTSQVNWTFPFGFGFGFEFSNTTPRTQPAGVSGGYLSTTFAQDCAKSFIIAQVPRAPIGEWGSGGALAPFVPTPQLHYSTKPKAAPPPYVNHTTYCAWGQSPAMEPQTIPAAKNCPRARPTKAGMSFL